MDQIKIKNLEVFGNHGVFPEEKALGQKFLVSADLYVDLREAGRLDDLAKSVHYGEVCRQICDFMKDHSCQLIEAAAEGLAEELLLDFGRIEKLRLELQKPWAPIGLPLDTVSVVIELGWHRAYVGLGSNLGDKKGYLDMAVSALKAEKTIRVEAVSQYLITKPYGGVEQDEFLNAGVMLKTLMRPEELLSCMQEIEGRAGRKREVRWGPRTLDLDLWFYDGEIIDTPSLTVPHPDLQNRDFVLKPMLELAPYFRHPVFHKTIRELWAQYEKNR